MDEIKSIFWCFIFKLTWHITIKIKLQNDVLIYKTYRVQKWYKEKYKKYTKLKNLYNIQDSRCFIIYRQHTQGVLNKLSYYLNLFIIEVIKKSFRKLKGNLNKIISLILVLKILIGHHVFFRKHTTI